jgi:hypothetical protein
MKGIKRNNMKKYINAILTLSSVLVLFYIIYDQHKQINAYKSNNLNKIIDSLQTELFHVQSEVGRYEITLELLSQEDTIAAEKFDRIYQTETE